MSSPESREERGTVPVLAGLSVVTLGHVHAEELEPLTRHFTHVEQLVLDIAPHDALALHRAELNRAIDAGSHDWVLIVREREIVDDALSAEAAAAIARGGAKGFRIRSVPQYCGAPLRLERDDGEVRLFHRRFYMRFANKGEWKQLMIQGTVVRLSSVLRSISFATVEAHREHLSKTMIRASGIRRVLQFLSFAIHTRSTDRNTIRYLWTEAAFQSRPLEAGVESPESQSSR